MGFLLFLALLLAAVLVLLAVPVELHVAGRRGDHLSLDGRWLFGLVRWRAQPQRREPSSDAREARAQPGNRRRKRRERRRGGRRTGRKVLAALLTPGLPSRATRLITALLREARPRDVWARARVGLEDPGDTGLLWAGLGPLSGLCYALPVDVVLEPDFAEPRLDVEGAATMRLVPLRVLGLVVGFLLSPAVLRAGLRAVRA